MDEPSANLDLQATNILKEELLSLREKENNCHCRTSTLLLNEPCRPYYLYG